ncbi:hypothetical protein HYX02_07915 [Candidatus Woesearchaeota archaeon]|nr:hypothetical protein [Candidatus Woesearchaeota archaeon]
MPEIVWNKVAGWTIIVLFIFLLIFIYYSSDKGFMSKVADLSLSFGEKYLPFEPQKELKQLKDVPQKVVNTHKAFNTAMEESLKKSTGEDCLVNIPSLADLSGFGIELSNLDNNMNSKIIEKTGVGYAALDKLEIFNAKVCLINAKNFYDCYIGPSRNCGKIYDDIHILRISKGELTIGSNKFELAPFAVNIEKNKLCFVPMDSGVFSRLKCILNEEKNLLDNDCIQEIKNKVPLCGMQLKTRLPNNKIEGPKREFERFVHFLGELDSKPYQNLCRKNFVFDTTKIGRGFYIFVYNDGRIDFKFDDNGVVEVIDSKKINYIPYLDLYKKRASDSFIDKNFNNHNSLGGTYIIQPAGHYNKAEISNSAVSGETLMVAIGKNDKWILTTPYNYVNVNYLSNKPICT